MLRQHILLFCSAHLISTSVKVKANYGNLWQTPYYNFKCPPYFNDTDCTSEVSPYIDPHWHLGAADILSEKEGHTLLGLSEILDVFEHTKSLIILTSFRRVNIPTLNYPVILRSLRAVWLWDMYLNNWGLNGLAYTLEELQSRRINAEYKNIDHYLLAGSPFWGEIKFIMTFYRYLNVTSYSLKTRPWNNLVSISLFPQFRLQQMADVSYTYFDYLTANIDTMYNIFPSTVQPIKIFVVQQSDKNNNDYLSKLNLFLELQLTRIRYGKFFLIETGLKISNWIGAERQLFLESLSLLHLCRFNVRFVFQFFELSNRWSALRDLNETTSLYHQNPKLNTLMFHYDSEQLLHIISEITIFRSIWKELQICHKKDFQRSGDSLEIISVAETYASVWFAIVGNHSYSRSYAELCFNGVELKRNSASQQHDIHLNILPIFNKSEASATIFYAVVSSVFNDFQFVACGYKGYQRLQYTELLTVFDMEVWIVLIIFTFMLALIFWQIPGVLASQLSIMQSIIIPLKLFLEQGNPFPDSLINNPRCKCISGMLMLMGIIVSNGYKNTNVYNLIIPRENIPYKYFHELLNDSFTIYTRSETVSFGRNILKKWCMQQKGIPITVHVEKAYMYSTQYAITYYFEKHKWNLRLLQDSEASNLQKKMTNQKVQNVINNLTSLVISKTKLMPVTENVIYDVIKRAEIFENLNESAFEHEFEQQYFKVELDNLQNYLVECKQKAVVIPNHLGNQFIKNIENYAKDAVYQGLETYFETNLAFHLKGVVPQYLVKRAKYAERYGLWKRWQALFKEKYNRRREPKKKPLEPPSMTGNVIIIFALLVSGLIISTIWFFFEAWLINKSCFIMAKTMILLNWRYP